ncbi:hypothetical protein LCGC14_0368730 [marine sediment metagenome]|uniref:Uncharacterized protein n=1 Tax=marine sediment metagenome TaxID=412755 RepID=A0A0F9VSY3_9ZZZZ|nr:efflux RND transporter periplasmic adaptor subunit [Phycisphaerae bacterium]
MPTIPHNPLAAASGKVGRSRLVGAMLLAFLCAAVIAAGCREEVTTTTPPAPRRVTVQTIQPIPQLPDIIELPGMAQPKRVVHVTAEVSGRIEEILATEGAPISCDETASVIVRLNTDLLQAEYNRFKSEADYHQRDYERLEQARTRGVATQTEVDQARMRAETLKAQMQLAEAMLERSVIKAPIDGIVNLLPVEEGEYVQPGTLVAEIVDLDEIKVVVDVPERDVAFMELGAAVPVIVNKLGGEAKTFAGTITYISRLADTRTFTSRIEVTVDNRDGRLRTGQIVDVRLTRRIIADAVMIRLDAVLPDETGHLVYVVIDGLAKRRAVSLGIFQGNLVQIVSGLSAGDQLIVENHQYVAEGQTVQVGPSLEQLLRAEQSPTSKPAGDQMSPGALP